MTVTMMKTRETAQLPQEADSGTGIVHIVQSTLPEAVHGALAGLGCL